NRMNDGKPQVAPAVFGGTHSVVGGEGLRQRAQDQPDLERWMRQCIGLARVAKERGDAPVGCVIVRDGAVVAEGIEAGRTKGDVTCHAEVEAIRAARRLLGRADLSDCTLVTTHEPCILCSYVIRHHRIARVVLGLETGEIGGYSSALPVLTDTTIKRWAAPPVVVAGVLREACAALMQ
ncbi:MAG TPA: nucleoside deaminase, partial [Flavobacteriales bacterium]|nr:nucleoside deaminase [Flavobacteriales bacterium]